MNSLYQELSARKGQDDPLPLTADDILAAARAHDRYVRKGLPRPSGYEMRFFENGSVMFRNTRSNIPPRILSLEQIREASRDFWIFSYRPLWQHIFWIWG